MKTLTLSIGLTCLLAMPLAQAADEQEDHAAHHPPEGQAQTGPANDAANAGPLQGDMQEGMKNMREQMKKIRATSDPAERKKLMRDHMQSMMENMRHMKAESGKSRDAGGGKTKTMDDGEEGADGAKKKDGMMKEGMMKEGMMMKHKKVEARLDMLQQMMEQMLEHEHVEQEMGSDR